MKANVILIEKNNKKKLKKPITKNQNKMSFSSILVYFSKYETINRSSASSFGHSDPDPSSVVFLDLPITYDFAHPLPAPIIHMIFIC